MSWRCATPTAAAAFLHWCYTRVSVGFTVEVRTGGKDMFRFTTWCAAAAVAIALAAPALDAQTNQTVVMKSGERSASQNVTFRWDKGHVATWRVGDVAYVDFGGSPDVPVELSGSLEAVVLRDGRVIKGQIL